MKRLLIFIPLSACLSAVLSMARDPAQEVAGAERIDPSPEIDWAAPDCAEPPTDAAGCLLAVEQAYDPATAEDAYQRGIVAGADPVTMNQSYVREMIALGLPGQAEDAAEEIVNIFPQDGVAWAVLAYADAARNDTTAALAELATAVDYTPDDPFVLGVAGKLMAWYRSAGLGDPSELPLDLAERLDEIHAQLWTNEYYRIAFEAAYAYYESQANVPVPDYPQEIAEPTFEGIAYTPDVCATYNEYVYSGFTVPCFSASWLVPRVGCYVVHDRPVYRYLGFNIGDRCGQYHSRFHVRRLDWHRTTDCSAYQVNAHVRLGSRLGQHLAPVQARYVQPMSSRQHAAPPSTRTSPPSPTRNHTTTRLSHGLDGKRPGRPNPPLVPHKPDSKSPAPSLTPRSESPPSTLRGLRLHRPEISRGSEPQARPADLLKSGIESSAVSAGPSAGRHHERGSTSHHSAPQTETRRPESVHTSSLFKTPIVEARQGAPMQPRPESKMHTEPHLIISSPQSAAREPHAPRVPLHETGPGVAGQPRALPPRAAAGARPPSIQSKQQDNHKPQPPARVPSPKPAAPAPHPQPNPHTAAPQPSQVQPASPALSSGGSASRPPSGSQPGSARRSGGR